MCSFLSVSRQWGYRVMVLHILGNVDDVISVVVLMQNNGTLISSV